MRRNIAVESHGALVKLPVFHVAISDIDGNCRDAAVRPVDNEETLESRGHGLVKSVETDFLGDAHEVIAERILVKYGRRSGWHQAGCDFGILTYRQLGLYLAGSGGVRPKGCRNAAGETDDTYRMPKFHKILIFLCNEPFRS